MLPFFGAKPTSSEIAECLREILEICPEYYPAQLDLGVRLLAKGGNKQAEKLILSGFETILAVEESADAGKLLDSLIDNLERIWRYDLSRRLSRHMVERDPDKAAFQDALARAEARLGEIEKALQHSSRAVALEPTNSRFRSNLGWFHLMAGKIEDAGRILEEARLLDPDDEVIRGNLEIHRYLLAHGGRYLDFLLRPADREELERLADADEWEDVTVLCASYNQGRIEAMAQCRLQDGGRDPGSLHDEIVTLRVFLDFVEGLVQGPYFLYEDVAFVEEHFKPIMHKFIFKHGDVDREIIESIYEVLFDLYGFLAGRGLVSGRDVASFRKKSLGLKREILDKMTQYNKVRHDDQVGEEEKEALRERLFEGDAFWPHL